jgi:uncharacterized protein YycO
MRILSRLKGCELRRYGPGESALPVTTAINLVGSQPIIHPGDFILTHSTGIYGRLIRLGEAFRYWGSEKIFSHWSHAAIFVNESGDIIEALGGGVQKRNISVYCETEYVIVHLPLSTSGLDRQQAVEFAEFCLGETYGYLTIVNIALCLLSGGKFSFGVDGQQICSALVARCLERVGDVFSECEPWHLMPADLAKHFDVRLIGDRGNPPHQDGNVIHFSRPGKRR